MEFKAALFPNLPIVVPHLKQVLCVRILLLQHFKLEVEFSPTRGGVWCGSLTKIFILFFSYLILELIVWLGLLVFLFTIRVIFIIQ